MKKIPQLLKSQIDKSFTLSYQQPQYSLLWMHGLCGMAKTYIPFWKSGQSPLYEGCKIKLIQAPQRFVTINRAFCNSWYDIRSHNRFSEPAEKVFDVDQVKQSFDIIDQYIKEEIKFWQKQASLDQFDAEKRVYIGGMSQGGVMALHYALSSSYFLGGAITLSGYLLPTTSLKNLGKVPLLLLHGDQDKIISEQEALNSYNNLLHKSSQVDYYTIKGLDHTINIKELEIINEWMKVRNQSHQLRFEML